MLNCAIVGCGRIAGGYDLPESELVRTHAKAFKKSSKCKLIGVCDSSADTVGSFAETWDVPFSTTNLNELFEQCKPDILSICTPTSTHREIFELACRQSVPRIWLEKPAAESRNDVIEMIELAQKYQVDVWVNYFRRYDSGFQKIKQRLPDIGKIQHVQAFYTKGLRYNGSHLIDLIHWLFGKVNSVEVFDLIKDSNYPAMNGIFYTENLKIHLTALDYNQFELFELDIIGSTGRILIKDGGQQIIFLKVTDDKYYKDYKNLGLFEKHESSYKNFMLSGLEKGLRGEDMPGFPEEMDIEETLFKCSLATFDKLKF
jgi:predicted dehydrogenase